MWIGGACDFDVLGGWYFRWACFTWCFRSMLGFYVFDAVYVWTFFLCFRLVVVYVWFCWLFDVILKVLGGFGYSFTCGFRD